MIVGRITPALAITFGLLVGYGSIARAQQSDEPKDDALDSLLQKLEKSSDRPTPKAEKSTKADHPDAKPAPSAKPGQAGKASDSDPKSKDRDARTGTGERARPGSAPKTGEGKDAKSTGADTGSSSKLADKDQEVDDLLQKLGETKETPSKDDRPRSPGGGGDRPEGGQSPAKPGKTERNQLTGKDKETDEHLEELTGRKKRKREDDGKRTGAVGEMIKEMRDVEQKLNKPDTGEGTREEQKKIVKRIDTMIEELKQSGSSSMRRLVMRKGRRPGQQPGQQPGNTEGSMARGAPPMKPARPTSKHSIAGGKAEWGHLPDELRVEVDNLNKEEPLTVKRELIDRYYLSIGKRKLVREE